MHRFEKKKIIIYPAQRPTPTHIIPTAISCVCFQLTGVQKFFYASPQDLNPHKFVFNNISPMRLSIKYTGFYSSRTFSGSTLCNAWYSKKLITSKAPPCCCCRCSSIYLRRMPRDEVRKNTNFSIVKLTCSYKVRTKNNSKHLYIEKQQRLYTGAVLKARGVQRPGGCCTLRAVR